VSAGAFTRGGLRREPRPSEVQAGADFPGMDVTWRSRTEQLYGQYASELNRQIDELVAQVEAVSRIDLIRRITVTPDPVTVQVLVDAFLGMSVDAAQAAQAELERQGATAPEISSAALMREAGQRAQATARMLAEHVSVTAQARMLRAFAAERPVSDIQADLVRYLREQSFRWVYDQLAGAMTAAQNAGRVHVLDTADGEWEASEILDASTCGPCAAVDGTRYLSHADAISDYPAGGYVNCVGGSRCRGTLIKLVEP
jgi:hypothetical protein